MKRLIFLFFIFLIPLVSAEDCGLLNLASCIPQEFFNFLINILNSPLQPLLDLTRSLITEPIELSAFASLWAIILYILSIFYGLLMFYSGFNFIISGYDSAKRAKAKEWFMNIFIMIVLIQASYFLYSLFIDIGSYLTIGMMDLVDPNFFLLTADNMVNIGLQFFFVLLYVIVLIFTTLFLTLRYLIVASGVVFVPIGIFLYFIPPVREYGKLILNFLAICIFITLIDSLIILISSQLINISLFANFKILVMISTFLVANFLMFYFMFFSAIKSALRTAERTAIPIMAVAKYFI